MEGRDQILESARPQLGLERTESQNPIEVFQNDVLRPILKLQNDVLLYRYLQDPLTLKAKFGVMDQAQKAKYVEQRIKADKKLQKELIGMVTGLFTLAEYEIYWTQRAEIHRRLLTMLTKRLLDSKK